MIGDEGVALGPFAAGLNYHGQNNADEIVGALQEALSRSTPTCIGYVPNAGDLPSKAVLLYGGLELDWGEFGLHGNDAGGATIQLHKLESGWRLVYITPFDFDRDQEILGPFQPCPTN